MLNDEIRISIVLKKKNVFYHCFSTVSFSVEIERPWESFISKISSLTLCSMTISSYVLFISPPIYIEGRLRQGCSLKTCGRAGSRQEDNTLGRYGNIGRSSYTQVWWRENIVRGFKISIKYTANVLTIKTFALYLMLILNPLTISSLHHTCV